MTSARRLAANRANAKKSTGPKTKRGKLRASSNATKHGLNVSLRYDAKLGPEVEKLALKIAAGRRDEECLFYAGEIADARIQYQRVCKAIRDLLHQHLTDDQNGRHQVSPAPALEAEEAHAALILSRISAAFKVLEATNEGAKPLTISTQLARLERYARRALSRRNYAVSQFNAACARS